MSEPQQSHGPKSPGPQGVAPEIRACGVAALARTASTVLRAASCRRVFRAATRLTRDYEIGSKEEVEYGYQYQEKKVTRSAGGMTLMGKQAITTYPGEEWTRNVLAHGWKDRGVVVITLMEKDNYQTDHEVLDRLWRSIRLVSGSR